MATWFYSTSGETNLAASASQLHGPRSKSVGSEHPSADEVARAPKIEQEHLLSLAKDLPRVWNSTAEDTRPKQRIVRAMIQEVVLDVDEERREAVAVIHWTGGRHTEIRVARNQSYYPKNLVTSPVKAVRALAERWSDWQIAVTLNRARCKSADGQSWTEFRVRELRERLKLPAYDRIRPANRVVTERLVAAHSRAHGRASTITSHARGVGETR